jgi:hypothetical protein
VTTRCHDLARKAMSGYRDAMRNPDPPVAKLVDEVNNLTDPKDLAKIARDDRLLALAGEVRTLAERRLGELILEQEQGE